MTTTNIFFRFRLNIIWRTSILILLALGFVFSIVKGFYLTSFFIGVLIVIAIVSLIQYVEATNRDIANFVAGIKFDDFTTTSSARHKGKSFGEMHEAFNLINRKFKDIRAEKEANHLFLHTIVQHIDVGLLCVDEDHHIVLMNKALQNMLHKSYMVKLDAIEKIDEKLYELVKGIKINERELIKINIDNNLQQWAIQAVELSIQDEILKLVSFQNIKTELEEQELDAWQKLIRILTHEIMNSVAPIASLSSTISGALDNFDTIGKDESDYIKQAINVIRKRSEALLDFTDTYRSLTRIPPPRIQIVDGKQLMDEVCTLFTATMEEHNIKFQKQYIPSSVKFMGDPNLLEQVLINLIKNAIDAVKEKEEGERTIKVIVKNNIAGKVLMQVIDSGEGISEEVLDQIFVPFFTTKEDGSGIGLSLSRQIMRMHKGTIEIQSILGQGTVVSLSI